MMISVRFHIIANNIAGLYVIRGSLCKCLMKDDVKEISLDINKLKMLGIDMR